jgi:hypothetical protein
VIGRENPRMPLGAIGSIREIVVQLLRLAGWNSTSNGC